MMPLNGMTLSERIDGMPSKLSIQLKPEGIGFEIKNVACGESNIMLNFEL